MRPHGQSAKEQFDPRAGAYLHSQVHAQGPDLLRAHELAERCLPAHARGLDVGCGAGHLSFALAPVLSQVVALDPAPRMLAVVAEAAAARGLTQIATREGSAESLPFPADHFDLVATRYSAHHWTRLDAALGEMRRVLKPGGYLLISDVLGDEGPLVDTHLQTIELLRDPSHVRNRSATEWRRLVDAAGFADVEFERWPTRLEFAPWIRRMNTPAARADLILDIERAAPSEVQAALAIETDGTFTVQTGLFWSRK